MAKILKSPVIIVINGDRINRTAGAILRGLKEFDKDIKLKGVVLTNVVPQQVDKLSNIVKEEGLELIGHITKDSVFEETMNYRHLGLEHAKEKEPGKIKKAFSERSISIDTDKVMKIAIENSDDLTIRSSKEINFKNSGITIGIVTGKAFTFYYPETIEIATKVGRVKFLDPENDQSAQADLILIGGGFPEIYSRELEKNKPFRSFIKKFVENGGYLYAECGGLMYLTDLIVYRGMEFKMAGVLDAISIMMERPVGHGYARAVTLRDTTLAARRTVLLGHEFHYSKIVLRSNYDLAIKYERGAGVNGMDGFTINNSYAHFMHIHPVTYDYISAIVKRVVQKK
jgi:cobyrinic acid a,c-diamide synthase